MSAASGNETPARGEFARFKSEVLSLFRRYSLLQPLILVAPKGYHYPPVLRLILVNLFQIRYGLSLCCC
jgi:hypothetical protein